MRHTTFGTETASRDWQLWAESVIHMPAALLGEAPEIAVVRTTFLKWVLMFFTAGKYAIMGIFSLQIPGPPCPQVPAHIAHFICSD